MRKPLIGITCGRYDDARGGIVFGTRPAYVRSIEQAGGIPVFIPPDVAEDTLRDIYARLDGVVLSGGADIDPIHYGMTNAGLSKTIDPARDMVELAIARWAAANDKPTLGICRGCQVINVALGGTLYQDLAVEVPGALDHDLG
ncbi:MAG TPA: gamma-glutamyl-gamma-aminobutyrate hydrolase family protein, partial [Aggregatilineales bacterium]|nr:gamma-glutamyl-gamma-aminobutyrate hydrolase family protein [Aggregatilineales bacterium]